MFDRQLRAIEQRASRQELVASLLGALHEDAREYAQLIRCAHAGAGTSEAHLLRAANLDDPQIIAFLQERAVGEVMERPSERTANNLAIVARLLRFETPLLAHRGFFEDGIAALDRAFPDFSPLLRYRRDEQRIRAFGPSENICGDLSDTEARFEARGDLNGANDARCRIASFHSDRGQFDDAENLLTTSLNRLEVEGYRTDPRIEYSSMFNMEDQEGFLRRSRSMVYLKKAQFTGRNESGRRELASAVAENQTAIGIFQRTGAEHGLANAFKERGLMERERSRYGVETDWAAWCHLAALKFVAVGDGYLARSCLEITSEPPATLTSQLIALEPGGADRSFGE